MELTPHTKEFRADVVPVTRAWATGLEPQVARSFGISESCLVAADRDRDNSTAPAAGEAEQSLVVRTVAAQALLDPQTIDFISRSCRYRRLACRE